MELPVATHHSSPKGTDDGELRWKEAGRPEGARATERGGQGSAAHSGPDRRCRAGASASRCSCAADGGPTVVVSHGSPTPSFTSRLTKCPRYLALRVHRVLGFLSRSQRNSWWKCRPSCLPRASLCRSRSRSSFQLLGVVFEVFSHNRLQQRRLLIWNAFLSGLWSRPLTFLLLLVALDRGLPHLLVL